MHHHIRNGMPSRNWARRLESKPWSDDAGGALRRGEETGRRARSRCVSPPIPKGPPCVFTPVK